MTASRIDLLRRMAVFGGLKPDSLEMILEQCQQITLEPREYFFHEGDQGSSLYVIEVGRVVVQRDWQGTPIVLGRLGEGDCFGEMSLIDFRPRSASVMAETPCQAMEIPSSSLRNLYQRDLEQYALIMMNMGREVSRRLRLASDKLFRLQQLADPHECEGVRR